jgi:ubiquinone/menaquinone biosynthesis C-methylase UbiE
VTNFSESKFAAWLQKIVSYRRQESGLYKEIANRLPLDAPGRILDIGTGTGLQLRAIHNRQTGAELYGLDLSAPSIAAARAALKDLVVDLRVGSIADAPYGDGFFDLVTCNSSMSYWEDLRACFNEIYRILKPGGQALLFEPHQNIDLEAALEQIRKNMRDKGPLRRWGAVQLNKFGLRRGNRIGMKLYSRQELIDLARSSSFNENFSIEETSLLNIPIFLSIHLWKPTC